MARKKKKSEDNLDTDNGLEEEKGGGRLSDDLE